MEFRCRNNTHNKIIHIFYIIIIIFQKYTNVNMLNKVTN